MSTKSLLSRMDDLVSIVESSLSSKQHSPNDKPTTNGKDDDEKKYAENTNMNKSKIGGLSLGNVKGRCVYQRFGYQDWTELAFKLETAYNLNYEINDDEQKDQTQSKKKKKKKKKKRYPRACICASGMNSISAIFHGIMIKHPQQKMNIIYEDELYDDTPGLIQSFSKNYNPNINLIKFNETDATELKQIFESDTIKTCDVNILFFESCSNPNGFVIDYDLIQILRKNSPTHCYVIVDNTWLTHIIFNPFEYGADFVATSLSKYYSGGECIAGAILHHGKDSHNTELFGLMSNWVRMNGIHVSPVHIKLVMDGMDKMKERIIKTSDITAKCAAMMHGQIGKCLMEVNHVSLKEHVHYGLYTKFISNKLWPSVISFKVRSTKMSQIRKWLASSEQLQAKTSFGGKDSRFDTYPWREGDENEIWCRFAVGYNDTFDEIKDELQAMIDKLQPLCV